MVMAILPKDYLSIDDVAEYFTNLGYEYDLSNNSDRYKINKDIYDLIMQNKIFAVFRFFDSFHFNDGYFHLSGEKARKILLENDDYINIRGYSAVYRYANGKIPLSGESGAYSINEDHYISHDDIYIPKIELEKLFKIDTTQNAEKSKQQIAELQSELAQVKAKLKEQTDKLAQHAAIDEGQGDTLLILGAVMDCIKEVAKPNYTQGLLINAITDKYKNTSSLTDSTLTKKFPKAKTYLKQNVTP
jgi:hypothetical protein